MAAANYVFIPYDYSRRQHDAIIKRHGHLVVVEMIYSTVLVPDRKVGIGVLFADDLPSLPRGWLHCNEEEVERQIHESVTSSTHAFWNKSSRCRLSDLLPMPSEWEVHEVEGGDWVPVKYRRGGVSTVVFDSGEILESGKKRDYIEFWDHWHSSLRYRLLASFLYRRERLGIVVSRGVMRTVPPNSSRRQILVTVVAAVLVGLVGLIFNQCLGLDF